MAVDTQGNQLPSILPSSGQGTTTTTGTTQQLPDWYAQFGQQLAGTGLGVLNNLQNFKGYTDSSGNPLPLTAGPSPDQQRAYGIANQNVADWTPYLDQSWGGLTQASSALSPLAKGAAGYDPSTLQKFMNPYVSNVVDEMGRLNARNVNENIIPGIDSTFASNGQFGSTRNADILGRTLRDNEDDLMGQQQGVLMNATNNANNLYNQWNQLGLSGASALGQMATAEAGNAGLRQQYGLNDVNSLLTTGGQQQATQQANLTNNYNAYLQQLQYPLQALGTTASAISPAISGFRPNVVTQSTNTANPTSSLQALTNILMGLSNPNGTGGALLGGLNTIGNLFNG